MWTNCDQAYGIVMKLGNIAIITNVLYKLLTLAWTSPDFCCPTKDGFRFPCSNSNALKKKKRWAYYSKSESFISMKVEAYPDRPLPVGPCRWKCLKEQICSFALPTCSRPWILWDITAEQTLSSGVTALIFNSNKQWPLPCGDTTLLKVQVLCALPDTICNSLVYIYLTFKHLST